MKKIIAKSILFLFILLVSLVLLSKVFQPKDNTKETSGNRDLADAVFAEPDNTLDLIVIGDSESYSGYIPLEVWNKYGITSYVCGAPAQKLPEICRYLYKILDEQNPKMVMLESDTIYKRAALSRPIVELGRHLLPVVEYHDRWKSLTGMDFFAPVNYSQRQENKGYYYSEKVKASKMEDYMAKTDSVKRISKSNRIYVRLIKEYCESKGIKFMLYSSPSLANWSYSKHNGIKKLAKSLNIDYLDLNLKSDKINIDWKTDSRDKGDHLNHKGALKATKYLGKYLHSLNIFEDHRQDEAYNSWNEAYNAYKERASKTL